jgi:hypothetical protein
MLAFAQSDNDFKIVIGEAIQQDTMLAAYTLVLEDIALRRALNYVRGGVLVTWVVLFQVSFRTYNTLFIVLETTIGTQSSGRRISHEQWVWTSFRPSVLSSYCLHELVFS